MAQQTPVTWFESNLRHECSRSRELEVQVTRGSREDRQCCSWCSNPTWLSLGATNASKESAIFLNASVCGNNRIEVSVNGPADYDSCSQIDMHPWRTELIETKERLEAEGLSGFPTRRRCEGAEQNGICPRMGMLLQPPRDFPPKLLPAIPEKAMPLMIGFRGTERLPLALI
jgi:hypothetical protein